MTATGISRVDVFRALMAEVHENNVAKGWAGPGSPPVSFGEAMALLHSEVSEALEAYRAYGLEDVTTGGVYPKPEGVGSEFADILIRLLDNCKRYGVDLVAEYERKMAYNRTRSWRHGGRAL